MEEHKIARIFGMIQLIIATFLATIVLISIYLLIVLFKIPSDLLTLQKINYLYLLINALITLPLCLYNASIGISLIRLVKHSYIKLQVLSLLMIFYLIFQTLIRYFFLIDTFLSSIQILVLGIIFYMGLIVYVEQRKKKASRPPIHHPHIHHK